MDAGVSGKSGGDKGGRGDLPSVGAHGLARQDGVGVHQGKPNHDVFDSAPVPSMAGRSKLLVWSIR